MKTKLIQNLSVNATQLVLNQLLGLGIFYILSTGLDKTSFGEINLALAVLLAVFNILSFGIDQLIIKKIAAGGNTSQLLSLYFFHVIIAGLLCYGLFFSGITFFKNTDHIYTIILLIGLGKMMIFFSTPFKQAATGLEKFRLLAYMLLVSNIIRCAGLAVLAITHQLNIHNIIIVFINGDVVEFLLCIYLFSRATKIRLTYKVTIPDYKILLFESLPQTGVVLITSALARFDWIFIGFILTAAKLAEYSFAYKIFEISTLPLLAIAPLLIPKFTKLFKQGAVPIPALNYLVKIEMIIAALTVLLLNIGWAPIIDFITAGKYGAVNVRTIFILSLSIPLLYLNNFFWTINFAKGRLKMILTSFIITFIVNVGGDILLIPILKNEGAAIAFLAACMVQFCYYLYKTRIEGLNRTLYPLIACLACAIISGITVKMLTQNIWIMFPSSVSIYIILLFITRQIKLNGCKEMLSIINLN
jgi:O-antigen/teichoic acid export membrane protein